MYGESYVDIGEDAATVTWRLLRGLRHSPPGPAASCHARRNTFDAALEQAEQLFRAARTVGPATRPLLAFYGLSQAGRAIASAAWALPDDDFQLMAHGITCPGLRAGSESPLGDVTVQNQGNNPRGAFVRVASVLESGSLPEPVRLGELWGLLPDLASAPLPGAGETRALSAQLLPPGEQIEIYDLPTGIGTTVELANDYLQNFTTLRGWAAPNDGMPITLMTDEKQQTSVRVRLDAVAGYEAPDGSRRPPIDGYGDQTLAFPKVGNDDVSIHPLLVWWALLFSLSMLARYEPERWARCIAIDASAEALPVEVLLDRALVMGPALAHQAIRQVSRPVERLS